MELIIWIITLTLAISVHEYAHGYVSYRLGDPTPKAEGRLTLNPIKHMDPIGLLFLLVLGFGWAAPVRVDPRYYKDERKGLMLVGLAGPLSNFVLVISSVILAYIFGLLGIRGTVLNDFLETLISINLMLGIFNLIPLPPLDGSKIVMGLLPKSVHIDERIGFVILILLLFTGKITVILTMTYTPIFELIMNFIN